jgi:hypothetical protein
MKSTILWDIAPCSPLNPTGLHGIISQKMVLLKYFVPCKRMRTRLSRMVALNRVAIVIVHKRYWLDWSETIWTCRQTKI